MLDEIGGRFFPKIVKCVYYERVDQDSWIMFNGALIPFLEVSRLF